ncbi:MAG: precorrin-6Y C5,15-methyltransferase (decarboxylating) subunit CbiT [Lachnospiraceae bacterium]|nr:precorrin-6Y C5,15-methyltransferase (decarboxylating) subunit CbiT [Lachnospiraceae bacterium]
MQKTERKNILVFGGTIEGRRVSGYLTGRHARHTVCVATEYGEEVLQHGECDIPSPGCIQDFARDISAPGGIPHSEMTIHQGRMNTEQMCELMREGQYALVVDATHPYAVEVSNNIREACKREHMEYVRYLRMFEDAREGSQDKNLDTSGMSQTRSGFEKRELPPGMVSVNSTREAAEYLESQKGGIFLTTGSKELHIFTECISDASRLFARVLPSAEVIASCRALGLEGKQICAMQGPFSMEMNVAMLRQTGASYLVTKDTGVSGGFPEKMEAARQCGITAIVIRRPEESGLDWTEVKKKLDAVLDNDGNREPLSLQLTMEKTAEGTGSCNTEYEKHGFRRQISCIGIGMGLPETLTLEAAREIREAQVIFGAKRVLESARILLRRTTFTAPDPGQSYAGEAFQSGQKSGESEFQVNSESSENQINSKNQENRKKQESSQNQEKPQFIEEYNAQKIYTWLEEHPWYHRAAILMSGDVGFYSGARQVAEVFPAEEIRYYCGISSIVYFASRIPTAWQDAKLLSAHGKELALLNYVKKYPKIILLVGGSKDVERLCKELCDGGMEQVRVTVGANLSYLDEAIYTGNPADFIRQTAQRFENRGSSLYIMMVENPQAGTVITPGIPDEEFVRGKVPMTKEEIRALSVAKLRLREDSIVYDVGAGTGSVSVECARLCTEGKVYAIERNPEGIALIQENSRKIGVSNLITIEGTAPDALNDLPVPTHAFIGGSSGNMREIIHMLREKNPSIRIVINTISMESIAEVMDLIKEMGLADADIVQVSAAKSRTLGRYHMMTAHNPVYIVSLGGGGFFIPAK